MVLAQDLMSILALSILFGLSLSVVTSATSAAVADLSRCENRGSAMGVFGTLMDVGHCAGPVVSGLLAGYFGFPAAFLGAAIVVFGVTALFWLQTARRKDIMSCQVG